MLIKKPYIIGSLIILLALLLGNFRTYLVLGSSDLPTFYSGDKVIINRSAYDVTIPFSSLKIFPWRSPGRGDMILCYFSRTGTNEFWLKRIIGIPGDTIEIRKNKILINHQPMRYQVLKKEVYNLPDKDESDILAIETGLGLYHTVAMSETENIISNFGPMVVLDNHYFVLGDNRTNSLDSRFLGLVNRNEIFGKYLFRIFRKE
ncbi:MAG: signal peptidase I [Bacteroidetes bacterium]|nr:signal peptidase I [Bacteroidota bacterium]